MKVFIYNAFIVLYVIVQGSPIIFTWLFRFMSQLFKKQVKAIYLYIYYIFIIHCNYTSLWLVAQWHAFLFRLVFKDGFLLA